MRSKVAAVVARNIRLSSTTPNGSGVHGASTSKSMLQIPAWGLVGLGVTAAGFFGKMLHDDNLATRQELKETSRELREDNKETRRESREDIKALRGEMKELRGEMKEGFDKINTTLEGFSGFTPQLKK